MSALARYFMAHSIPVAGYDRTPSPLTTQLQAEGALLHFTDDPDLIPTPFRDPQACLVVYTPAVPSDMRELTFFRSHGFQVEKRAQVLGRLTETSIGLCVAGTHGKTTTSAMTAHILNHSHLQCNAFVGGIMKNYASNYLLAETSPYVVVEADEYDRSFHQLRPFISVITSIDPDHLDIYGSTEAYAESFQHYASLIKTGGALIRHHSITTPLPVDSNVRTFTYSQADGDFHADNIRIDNGKITFDFISPLTSIADISLGQPIPVNIDNSIAAMAMAQLVGCTSDEVKQAIATFSGVERRFDFHINNPRHVLLSDYAHHPKEILQCVKSMRQIFPNRKISAIFQPHLYSRTRDFYTEFAAALSMLDEVMLCEIYPAREKPIPGITSQLIVDALDKKVKKQVITSTDIPDIVCQRDFDVLLLLGAGDINKYIPQIVNIITEKEKEEA